MSNNNEIFMPENKSNKASIIVAVIAICLILGGVYLLNQSFSSNKPAETNTASTTPTKTETAKKEETKPVVEEKPVTNTTETTTTTTPATTTTTPATTPTTTKGLRHIQMRENHVRENVERKLVSIAHVGGKVNMADLFTKEMKDTNHFVTLQNLMMRPCPSI